MAASNRAVGRITSVIRSLGLRVTPNKTEAVFLHDGSRGRSSGTQIMVGFVGVQVALQIKYMGLVVDGTWSYDEHFRQLAPRLERAAAALDCPLPNLEGLGEMTRRHYAGTV